MKNREIKFRAWDNKTMYAPFTLIAGLNDKHKWYAGNYPDDTVFLEFTGLHDKNGNEIYEGDILKKDGSMSIYKAEIGMHWIKGFQQYGFHLKVNYNPNHIGFSNIEFDLSVLNGIEIIGNIYENAGLLAVSPLNICR